MIVGASLYGHPHHPPEPDLEATPPVLYRLTPPANAQWNADFPAGTQMYDSLVEHGVEFDTFEWKPTEGCVFSLDFLRLALRHGVATNAGIVVNGMHMVDLGHADRLRVGQDQIDETQAKLRQQNDPLMEKLMPGWTTSGVELDARVRESTESAARQSEADLAKVLAAPVVPELAEHWVRLGGELPD